MPKAWASKRSTWSRKPPHRVFILPGAATSASNTSSRFQRSRGTSAIASTPLASRRQYASGSGALREAARHSDDGDGFKRDGTGRAARGRVGGGTGGRGRAPGGSGQVPDELLDRGVIPHQGGRQGPAEMRRQIAGEGGGLDRVEPEAIEAFAAVEGTRRPSGAGWPAGTQSTVRAPTRSARRDAGDRSCSVRPSPVPTTDPTRCLPPRTAGT